MTYKIKKFTDIYKLSRAASEFFVTTSKEAIKDHGYFSVALSGGGTPESMYALLATDAYASRVNWSKVHLFWSDERMVHPRNIESNYRMARYALIAGVSIPDENIHRIHGETKPDEAAANYETEMRNFFPEQDYPRFDLILLGMGSDGHTASLFPRSPALEAQRAWAVASYHEDMGSWRVTLTLPVINNAANIMVLVSGINKAKRLKKVLEGKHNPQEQPIQAVSPHNGKLVWLLDNEAAAELEDQP